MHILISCTLEEDTIKKSIDEIDDWKREHMIEAYIASKLTTDPWKTKFSTL